jgi:cell division protein FtsQ
LKKILHISFWSGMVLLIFVVLGFTKKSQSELVCSGVEIEVDYSNHMFFLKNEDVLDQLKMSSNFPVGKMLREIDLHEIENLLVSIPEVKSAEVFKSINGTIGIRITQRTPIVRVLNLNGKNFFIDADGYQMKVTGRYFPRVLVVNGYVSEPELDLSAMEIEKDSALAASLKMDDIYKMALFINNDPFWKAQIQEMYFNAEGEIELVPVVGQHRIIFGDAQHMEEKFNKLFVFYKDGLKKSGWNKYETVNLKYKNQVVCRKKNYLPQ